MCFTGAALAFEQEITAWAERDARQVAVPANGSRLTLPELQAKLRAAQPEFRGGSITLENRADAAVAFNAGRENGYYADPYTGEIRQPASSRVRHAMRVLTEWHRYLARSGDSRATGKLINGVCNLAFCFLAVSGLFLWLPRIWSWRGVRAVAMINFRTAGKARDFNWHNAIGLWSAPILIVLTLTAVPISFRWGGNLITRLAGEEVSATPTAPTSPPTPIIKPPSPEARPLGYDALAAIAQKEHPRWTQLTLRSGGAAPGREGAPPDARRENRGGLSAVTITLREAGSWPRTAVTTLMLDPFTGEILARAGYADLPASRQIRSWTRFLHTGQALGWVGQLVAGLACVGGCFLVYTGFALSWRRFFGRKPTPTETSAAR